LAKLQPLTSPTYERREERQESRGEKRERRGREESEEREREKESRGTRLDKAPAVDVAHVRLAPAHQQVEAAHRLYIYIHIYISYFNGRLPLSGRSTRTSLSLSLSLSPSLPPSLPPSRPPSISLSLPLPLSLALTLTPARTSLTPHTSLLSLLPASLRFHICPSI
jgi:hypothetical protein